MILLTVNMCVLIAMVILMHMSYRIPLRLVNDDYAWHVMLYSCLNSDSYLFVIGSAKIICTSNGSICQ